MSLDSKRDQYAKARKAYDLLKLQAARAQFYHIENVFCELISSIESEANKLQTFSTSN